MTLTEENSQSFQNLRIGSRVLCADLPVISCISSHVEGPPSFSVRKRANASSKICLENEANHFGFEGFHINVYFIHELMFQL